MIRLSLTIVLLAGFITAACKADAEDSQPPDVVVESFYQDYIEHNPPAERFYAESPYVTQGFVQEIDAALQGPIAADPILCAQNVPSSVTAEVAALSDDTTVVSVISDMPGHAFSAELVKDGDDWKLNHIECAPPA